MIAYFNLFRVLDNFGEGKSDGDRRVNTILLVLQISLNAGNIFRVKNTGFLQLCHKILCFDSFHYREQI